MSYLYLVFITIFYSLFKILSVAYQLKCNVNYLYFCVQTFSCLGEVFLNFSIGLQIVTSGSDGVNGVLNRLVSIAVTSSPLIWPWCVKRCSITSATGSSSSEVGNIFFSTVFWRNHNKLFSTFTHSLYVATPSQYTSQCWCCGYRNGKRRGLCRCNKGNSTGIDSILYNKTQITLIAPSQI